MDQLSAAQRVTGGGGVETNENKAKPARELVFYRVYGKNQRMI